MKKTKTKKVREDLPPVVIERIIFNDKGEVEYLDILHTTKNQAVFLKAVDRHGKGLF